MASSAPVFIYRDAPLSVLRQAGSSLPERLSLLPGEI